MAESKAALIAKLIEQLLLASNQIRRIRFSSLPSSTKAVLEELLKSGPRSVPNLARARQTSRQNIQVIVNRLKTQDWVNITANPAHKRSPIISLTPKAEQALGLLSPGEDQAIERVAAEFNPDELVQLNAALAKFRKAWAQAFGHQVATEPPQKSPAPVRTIPTKDEDEEIPVALL